MEYHIEKKEIRLNRNLSELDKFVLDFINNLDEYVIVSGYVSILFGRSRATEDIDLLIPKMEKSELLKLWNKIHENNFECINTSIFNEASEMLKDHAIRFSRKGKAIPNIEFKIIKNELDKYSYDNKIKVLLKQGILFISPLEMQVAYKLYLGSEKDLEDAKHLYELFKEKINKQELSKLIKQLGVEDKFKLIE